MDRKLTLSLLVSIFLIYLIYFLRLFIYAFIYQDYYENSLLQVPFNFYSLLVGGILSIAVLLSLYVMATQKSEDKIKSLEKNLKKYKDQLMAKRKEDRNLIAEFLVTQKLGKVFNSELFEDLQERGPIEEKDGAQQEKGVEKLSGGYSGAQIYKFYREDCNVPDVLKLSEVEEIENEYQKFIKHVKKDNKRVILPIGPNECHKYRWGSYGGLEYNFVRDDLDSKYLTFLELYREGLYDDTQKQIEVTATNEIVKRLFKNLGEAWKWTNPDLRNLNIYEQYYPFTDKFAKIRRHYLKLQKWQSTSDLKITTLWNKSWGKLHKFLDVVEIWDERRGKNDLYSFPIAMGVIHGDLNSRNILLGINPENYDIRAIRLVDFSHTGNGLTEKQTRKFVEEEKIRLFCDRYGIYLGHIANDFCRLEADIKFYLTDLDNEQDLKQAWILECLLLEHRLELPDWEALIQTDAFKEILKRRGLSDETEWKKLGDSSCWEGCDARKFKVAWQSVKAIRDSLREILGGEPPMPPFYLALLQAGLTMIYYEDHRFHNANLQKLYLVLASALLCEQLLES